MGASFLPVSLLFEAPGFRGCAPLNNYHAVSSVFSESDVKFCSSGRGLTIVGSILEGDFNERADDVALAKEVSEAKEDLKVISL